MTDPTGLVRGIEIQAAGCTALGSPFSGALLTAMARDVTVDGPSSRLFEPWLGASTRTVLEAAAPLRLLGALHDLVLSGAAPALAATYPRSGAPGDADAAWPQVLAAMDTKRPRLAAFMTHEPQTNEVGRAGVLLAGFLTLAQETGLPLRCFELGASAGLNQQWDHFRYELADAGAWGDPAAPVVIDVDWRGAAPPLGATVSVLSRAACDRKPVDLTVAAARRRLRAYVWADQPDRLARLDGAIDAALAAGTAVEAEDAVDWTRRRAAPAVGAATVLYHSVVWQYMPAYSQAALTEAIDAHGAAARPSAPFAWLRMEPDQTNLAAMELRLTVWPGGDERRLAFVHPHGAWVEWL